MVFSRASDSSASVDTVAVKVCEAWPAVFVAVTVTVPSPSTSGATVTWLPAILTRIASPDPDALKTSAVPVNADAASTTAGSPPVTRPTSGS